MTSSSPSIRVKANTAIDFDGTTRTLTFGPPPELRRLDDDARGLVPARGHGGHRGHGQRRLLGRPHRDQGTKPIGRASTYNMNFFLGIDSARPTCSAPISRTRRQALNHPVRGATAIPADGTWHHAAATYDGSTWRLYLDGVLDGTLVGAIAFQPSLRQLQHAAIGSALTPDRRSQRCGLLRWASSMRSASGIAR